MYRSSFLDVTPMGSHARIRKVLQPLGASLDFLGYTFRHDRDLQRCDPKYLLSLTRLLYRLRVTQPQLHSEPRP